MALTLLLVDDDSIDRMAVRRCLKTSGLACELHEASDAAAALALIETAHFDCILVDYRLPDRLGTNLLRDLSLSSSSRAVPVIMLTGQGDEQVAAESIMLGAQDYLTKDRITPEALRRSVVNAIEKMALKLKLERQQDDLALAYSELERKVADRTAELTAANAKLRLEVEERRKAQVALSASEQFLKETLDALTAHIAILDHDGVIVAVNEAWRTFGTARGLEAPDAGVGLNYLEQCGNGMNVSPQDDIEKTAQGVRDVVSGRCDRFYTEYPCHGLSEQQWFALRATSFLTRQTNWTVVAHEDITSRVNAEVSAREHQARLAHVSRVNVMGEMGSSLAHELNQPLTALDQYCEALMIMVGSQPQEQTELERVLQQAQTQAQRAGAIVRRLRDFASTGRLEKSTFDLTAVVKDSVAFTEHEARNKGIAVSLSRTPDACSVYADRVQIEQVLVNLLRNSIDAMELAESPVRTIKVSTTVLDAQTVQVCLSDTGPGLGQCTAKDLFGPFNTSKPEGMGLGLSISRSLVEAHGGHLWAQPASDRGATFCFTLPSGSRDDTT